jgi:hypothetical protein
MKNLDHPNMKIYFNYIQLYHDDTFIIRPLIWDNLASLIH